MAITEWTPTTATELGRIVSENFQNEKHPFSPVGGRTAINQSSDSSPEMIHLLTSQLNRVVDYPSRDMTITVEAGIRIEALQEILREKNQRLPIDIPQAGRASLGGAIAANVSGPSRYGYGTFRDYVIGITAVDGQGRLFSAGGKVVKNVAGYDLCKLLIGSRGSLATITEVTLKLRPLSEANAIVLAAFEPEKPLEPILAELNKSATRPVVLDLLNPKAAWHLNGEANQKLPDGKNLLWIEFAGTTSEVSWQASTVQEEVQKHQPTEILVIETEEYQPSHDALVEFRTTSDDPLTFHASFPKSRSQEFLTLATEHEIALQIHAGNGVAYGHLPDRCTTSSTANEMLRPFRDLAESSGGGLTILNSDPEWSSEIESAAQRNQARDLMQGIKKTLDPANLMSPGLFL
ncbi:MAG: FAD-binding oxidoreductase [Planctomicrobium sp.]|nr:FAD-binding oxidoreductase [Planctomicrobium sp.]